MRSSCCENALFAGELVAHTWLRLVKEALKLSQRSISIASINRTGTLNYVAKVTAKVEKAGQNKKTLEKLESDMIRMQVLPNMTSMHV